MSQSNPAQGEGEAAYEALFRAHEASMYRLAFQICNDPRLSADVVAEGFARAWPRFKAGTVDDLPTAVRKIIVKELNTRLRSARGQPTAAVGDDPVRRALQALPLRRRTIMVLRFQADLSPVDAAEASGLSLSIVKGETKKGVRQLSKALALPDAGKPRPSPIPAQAPASVPPTTGLDVSGITPEEGRPEWDLWAKPDQGPLPDLWAEPDEGPPPAPPTLTPPTLTPPFPPPTEPEPDVTTYDLDIWPDIIDAEIIESPPKGGRGDPQQ